MKKIKNIFLTVAMIAATTTTVYAATWQEEQAIDEELGLLELAPEINLLSIQSRYDLPKEMKAGFLPYNQEPETAMYAPSELFTTLETPVVVETPAPTPAPVRHYHDDVLE